VSLTQQQLETHLWGAAKILRGKTAGQDYKNYILSLMFYKRLCDQWDAETDEAIAELESQQGRVFSERERAIFRSRGEHRFNIPYGARWGDVKAAASNLGEVLTKAMRSVAASNEELRGVFTVDWNQPAPDGSGRPLIQNEVVHALIQHFDEHNLSNRNVSSDVLGRAYEFLIKQFADDAGAKAGEFFTPPEVGDTLVRMLNPQPGDTIYDPTAGSGGMLIHSASFLRSQGHHATAARYFAQEMNWGNAAIGKINSVLHGLEADIRAGTSTITDPQHVNADGSIKQFSLVLANFPFSDDFWWLRPEQQTDDKKKKEKLRSEVFKGGYRDMYGRFGSGTSFNAPPAAYGDYAFLLHILGSMKARGRAGVVCPQGVLFRGQPESEEQGAEEEAADSPRRKRKADDEHLIRSQMLKAGVIETVVSLPLNIFYGAGVPACLVILRKSRPLDDQHKVLFVYAARHFGEAAGQNFLRPQDVMRILVHYHARGDASKVEELSAKYADVIRQEIKGREADEVGRLDVEAAPLKAALETAEASVEALLQSVGNAATKTKRASANRALVAQQKQVARLKSRIEQLHRRIEDAHARADQDRSDLAAATSDLVGLYSDPVELAKHSRLVDCTEIEENDFNLNIPRYVDTFEPEDIVPVEDAYKRVLQATEAATMAEAALMASLERLGYAR
jgi:type I restriction enzyme M protein